MRQNRVTASSALLLLIFIVSQVLSGLLPFQAALLWVHRLGKVNCVLFLSLFLSLASNLFHIIGIGKVVAKYAFVKHLVFSLLKGRPVVIYGQPSREREIRDTVHALSLFVPGRCQQNLHTCEGKQDQVLSHRHTQTHIDTNTCIRRHRQLPTQCLGGRSLCACPIWLTFN